MLDRDLTLRQQPHEVDQQPARDNHRPLPVHLRFDRRAQRKHGSRLLARCCADAPCGGGREVEGADPMRHVWISGVSDPVGADNSDSRLLRDGRVLVGR